MKPQLRRPSLMQKRAFLAAVDAADGNMRAQRRTDWSDEDREIVLVTGARMIEAEMTVRHAYFRRKLAVPITPKVGLGTTLRTLDDCARFLGSLHGWRQGGHGPIGSLRPN